MRATAENYLFVKGHITALRSSIRREMEHTQNQILSLKSRQKELEKEYISYEKEMQRIGEFELETEYKYLAEHERNCDNCGKPFVPIQEEERFCHTCLNSSQERYDTLFKSKNKS